MAISPIEQALIQIFQHGLPLVARPYQRIGDSVGLTEAEVIDYLKKWQADGTIRRFGVVVRHHELGYQANAMIVWDVPDHSVQALGERLGAQKVVTLCYQRPRRLPDWPYNLFCMIHGQDRATVLQYLSQVTNRCGMQAFEHEVLFSCRRFKQQGAHTASVPTDCNEPKAVVH